MRSCDSSSACDIAMIGPDPTALGGISRVVSVWKDNGFFEGRRVLYIPSVGTEGRIRKAIRFFMAIVALVRVLKKGCPLVYLHTAWHRSFYRKSLFLLLSRFAGKKVVIHIHPTGFYNLFIERLSGMKRKYSFWILNQTDAFVVLSREMEEFTRQCFPKTPIRILPNSVDVSAFEDTRKIARDENMVIYLGWYLREKGVYDLVDAVELLLRRGVKCYVDFYGTNGENELRSYVKSKDLKHFVRVNGWIDHVEKVKVLHRAALLVLPSYSEGMPNVILEAMAAKTPIVATPVGVMKEMLRDGENAVLVKPGDPVGLSDMIELCLSDPLLRQRLADRAYQDAISLYDVSVVKLKFKHVLRDLNL